MEARITVCQRRKIIEELKVQVRAKKGGICCPLHVESLVELAPETWPSDCQQHFASSRAEAVLWKDSCVLSIITY